MHRKDKPEDFKDRDFAQDAWEREVFAKPFGLRSPADLFRFWMQPKRLRTQLVIAAILLLAIGAFVLWLLFVS